MVNRKRIYTLFLLLTVLGFLIIDLNYDISNQSINTVLVILVYILTCYNLLKLGSGLTFVYLSYLVLTHAGIPIIELLIESPLAQLKVNTSWYELPYREKAVSISYIFITSYCSFAMLLAVFSKKSINGVNNISIDFEGDKKWLFTGELLVIGFFLYLIYQFLTGRLPLFGTYQNYFSALGNLSFYSTAIFLYAVGCTMIFSNISRLNYKRSIFFILLPGFLLLITGNRGELFYPLLAGLGVLLTRGMKINYKLVLTVLIVLFIVIPSIKEVRNIENITSIESFDISVADPFIQMGYTLRPLVFTVGWVEGGEDYIFGESFLVPFQRGLSNFIPFMAPIEYEGKPYSFRDRLPTMGYSIVAETYYNFGIFGTFIIPFLLVFFLTRIGDSASNFLRLTVVTGITAILINNIRNAFAFVPGQSVMFLGLLVTIIFVRMIISRDKKVVIR